MKILQKIFNSNTLRREKVLMEKLEIERSINHFASSLIEQNTVDEILWSIIKNCIRKLNFTDCVIYWLDSDANILLQKAAYGGKNPKDQEIFQPIQIPLGKGIVGNVALNCKAEIVKDTSKDERYIADDEVRYSEITVPIICDAKVVGVIDAEHPEKNFFRPKHLKILSKIASIAAAKIQRLQIEEAYRSTALRLMENNKWIAETKLLALRLQMNPHFIFNSLNSINNFILQHQAEQASEYLNKFSKLIRQISDNMKTEWVSLKNELQALQIYLELEQLRSDNKFEIELSVCDTMNPEMVHVPPLFMQPYIENAIRHGLLNKKDGKGIIKITCCQENSHLVMQIEDNGIGRSAAAQMPVPVYKSGGIKITEERLQIVNEIYNADAQVQIEDLYNTDKTAAGTKVTFTLKIKNA
jgi:two-component system, LytTR family, sensor kinase